MAKFRAIALNPNSTASAIYGPIRTVKAVAEKDRLKLQADHPELVTTAVIAPGEPLWNDD